MKLDESIKNYDFAGDVTPVVTSTEATAIEVSKDKQKKKDEIIPDFRDVDPTPGSDKAEKPEKVEFPKLNLDESLFTEVLNDADYSKFQSEVYNALAKIAEKYEGKGAEEKCFNRAFKWFMDRFFEYDEDDFADDAEFTADSKVIDWMTYNFPTEFQLDRINPDITFNQLKDALENGKDFYDVMGDFDSAVRENIFAGLEETTGKPYDYYYNIWMNS